MADAYVCIRKCYYKKRLFKKGDFYTTGDPKEKVPKYFAKEGTPVPADPTPRLGTKVMGVNKPLPSLKAPGKKDAPKPEE